MRFCDPSQRPLPAVLSVPVRTVFALYAVVIVVGLAWLGQDFLFADRQNATGTHVDPSSIEVGEGITVNRMEYHEGWSLSEESESGKPTIVGLKVTNRHGAGFLLPGDREVLVDVFFYDGDAVVYEVLCSSPGSVAPGKTAEMDCSPFAYDWPGEYDRIEFVQVDQ